MSITNDAEWFHAVASGNVHLVNAYVSKYARTRDANSETGLMVATRASAFPVIRILAEYEAGLINNDGCTALMLAAMSDNGRLCGILVEYEADAILPDGRDALILAAQIGNLEAMHELVKVCNLIQDCNQLTALDHSTNEGHLDCVRVLVRSYEITLEEINYCIVIAEERHYTAIYNYLQKVRDGDMSDDPSFFDATITQETIAGDTTIEEPSPRDTTGSYYNNTMSGSNLTGGINGVSKARLMKLIESLQGEIADLRQQNSDQRDQLMRYIEKIPTTPIVREASTRNSSICYPNRVLDEVKFNVAADEDLTSPSIDLSYHVNDNPFMISRVVSQAPVEDLLAEKDEEIRRLRAINDDLRLTIQNANFAAYQTNHHSASPTDKVELDLSGRPIDSPVSQDHQAHQIARNNVDSPVNLRPHAELSKTDSVRKISFSTLQPIFGTQASASTSFTVSPSIIASKRDDRSFHATSNLIHGTNGNASLDSTGTFLHQQQRKSRPRPYSGHSNNAVFNTELSLKLTQVPPLLNNTFGDQRADSLSTAVDLCHSNNSSILGTPNQLNHSFLRGRKILPQRTPRKSTEVSYKEARSVNFDSNRASEITDAPDIDMPDFPIEAASSTLGTRRGVLRKNMRRSESFRVESRDSCEAKTDALAGRPRIFSANPKCKVRSRTPRNATHLRPKTEASEICVYEDLDDSFVEYIWPSYDGLLREKSEEIERLQAMAEELANNLSYAYHLVRLNQEATASFIHTTANNSQHGNVYSFLRVSQTSQPTASVQHFKSMAPRESEADGFIIGDYSISLKSGYSPYTRPALEYRDGRSTQSADEGKYLVANISAQDLHEFLAANGLQAYSADLSNDFIENGQFNLAIALRELTKFKYAKSESPAKRFSVYRSPSQYTTEGAAKPSYGSLSYPPLITAELPTSPLPSGPKDITTPMSTGQTKNLKEVRQEHVVSRYVTPLMIAVSEKDLDGVKSNMQYAGIVNDFGETALMMAVDLSFVDAVKLLVDEEAGIVSGAGLTALQLALQSNNLKIADILKAREGVPSDNLIKESGRQTDLMYAAEDNNLVNVYCFSSVQARLQDMNGRTALMYAAAASRFEAARLLYKLESGIRGNKGETALMAAAYAGSGSIARLLVSKEAKCMGLYEPEISEEHSALMIAAYNGHVACVRILAQSEHSLVTPSGNSALVFAEKPKYTVPEAVKHEVISILQGYIK